MWSHEEWILAVKNLSNPDVVIRNAVTSETGIKSKPAVSEVTSLHFPQSYGIDVMHIGYLGVSPQLTYLFGKKAAVPSNKTKVHADPEQSIAINSLRMSTKDQANFGRDIVASHATIPSSFGSCIPNPFEPKGNIKAEQWQIFSTLLAVPLLAGRISKASLYSLHCYATILLLSAKHTVTRSDLQRIRICIKEFKTWYSKEVISIDVSYATYVLHAFEHIPFTIEQTGPVSTTWQYPLEKLIGFVAPKVQSKNRPYKQLGLMLFDVMNCNLAKVLRPDLDQVSKIPRPSLFYSNQMGYEFNHPSEECGLSDNQSLIKLLTAATGEPVEQNANYVKWARCTLFSGDRIGKYQ
jgi:hypothetical protein